MKRTPLLLLLAVLIPGLALLSGCNSPSATSHGGETPEGAPGDVVATVAGQPLTLGEIMDNAAGGLVRVRQDRYDLLRGTIERLGIDRLLAAEAAERGISLEELRLTEIDAKIQEPTERELERAYEANRNRARGQSFQQLRQSIFNTIRRERVVAREVRFYDELKQKYGFSVALAAPRVDIALDDANPVQGPADAPITLVEFGDYQCPFCRRAHTTVQRVLTEYKDKIRYVFMDYPLPNHDRAVPAAEAAYCAGEQDMYWDYSEHLMVMAGDLNDDDLRGRAEELGMDVGAFMSCYTSGRYADVIGDGLELGLASGVDRTPTFFINGRILSGAKSYEIFKMIIDEELATLGG